MPPPKEKIAALPPVPPKEPSTQLAVPATPQGEELVETALRRAEQQMYYRTQLLKLIAKQLDPKQIYVYVTGQTCRQCNGSVKRSKCNRCGSLKPENIEEELSPYLSGEGARFVLSSAGARFEDPLIIEKTYQGTEGPYVDFEVWVTVITETGRCVRTMGNNSTDDDFYAKRWRWVCTQCEAVTHYQDGGPTCPVHGKCRARRDPYWLSLQEVDIPSVKQKAMTNAWNHAVRDLGYMPTIEHLKNAGVNIGRLKRMDFSRRDTEEEFSDAKDSGAAPERSGAAEPTRKANPTAAPQTQTGVTSGTGGEKTASSPTLPPKHGDPTPRPSQPAQAILPKRIESVRAAVAQNGDSKGNIYLRIVQEGRTLFCFDNRKMGEDERLFDILKDSEGQDAQLLVVEQMRKSDGKKFLAVVGALRIGDREWEADGTPVLRRERYQSEDADVPL